MSTTANPIKLTATGKLQFTAFHQPSLADGDYTLNVTQEIASPTTAQTNLFEQAGKFTAPAQYFSVAGPRFNLTPDDILSVFPAAIYE